MRARTRFSGAAGVLAAAAVLVAGCYSSRYVPQSRARVSTVMIDSKIAYVRDGQVYEHGMFGRGLIAAVAGNPRAEAVAREAHQRTRNGFLLSLLGFTCSGVAAGLALRDLDVGLHDDDDDVPRTELIAMAGCTILGYAGLFRAVSAQPLRFDAINIFNDDPPDAPFRPTFPGGAPGAR